MRGYLDGKPARQVEWKKKRGAKKWIPEDRDKRRIALIVAGVLGALLLGLIVYQIFPVYGVCKMEAGTQADVSDFLRFPSKNAHFAKDNETYDSRVPGEYTQRIKAGLFTHTCRLIIQDTTAPELVLKPATVGLGETCTIDSFINNLYDVTETKTEYTIKPDFTKAEGTQAVEIKAVDAAGNETVAQTELVTMPILGVVDVEVGEGAPPASRFLLSGMEGEIEYTNVPEERDHLMIGTYEVGLRYNGKEYTSRVNQVDTQPPEFTTKYLETYPRFKLEASAFVAEENDSTTVAYTFETEPDPTTWEKGKTYVVMVVGTDEGGNQTRHPAAVVLNNDTENPVFDLAEDFDAFAGTTIAYKNMVTVSDNSEDAEIEVDASAVDNSKVGTYPVHYTARDASGNETKVTINCNIVEMEDLKAELDARVDAILAEIITEGMTEREKAKAIFDYIQEHASYVSTPDMGNWVEAAWQGLETGLADCTIYQAMAKEFLDRAGIKNMNISRIPAGEDFKHSWNLIDIADGHGWYHYDTCPRMEHNKVFLWDDAQVKAYSARHDNCYNYDPAEYPEIP